MNASLLIVAVLCKAVVGTPVTWEFQGGGPEWVGGFTGFFTYDDEAQRTDFRSGTATFSDGHSRSVSSSTYEGFGEISLTGTLFGHVEATSDKASILVRDDFFGEDLFVMAIPFGDSYLFVQYEELTQGVIEAPSINNSGLKDIPIDRFDRPNENSAGIRIHDPPIGGEIFLSLRVVPEPATFALLALGIAGLVARKGKQTPPLQRP